MRYRGVVQKGKRIAGRLGFPTINIPMRGNETGSGIFAATVRVEHAEYPAAAYLDQKRRLVEAHLLDFSGDLYGREAEVVLEKKIRASRKFLSSSALQALITDDIAKIREYFKK